MPFKQFRWLNFEIDEAKLNEHYRIDLFALTFLTIKNEE